MEFIRGRRVVGYHINMKLNDIGILEQLLFEDLINKMELVDCARMFNPDISAPQQPMRILCKDHLNLAFAKKPFPYAVFQFFTHNLYIAH